MPVDTSLLVLVNLLRHQGDFLLFVEGAEKHGTLGNAKYPFWDFDIDQRESR